MNTFMEEFIRNFINNDFKPIFVKIRFQFHEENNIVCKKVTGIFSDYNHHKVLQTDGYHHKMTLN